MRSPASAMLWQIWRAQRWGLMLCMGYLAIAAIVVQFLPAIVARASLAPETLANVGWHLTMPCLVMFVYLLAVFSVSGSADFQEKGYSPWMLTLPVSTRQLALVPIVAGCATLGATWLAVVWFIQRPTQNQLPYFWPIAAIFVLLTMLQAISWTPFSQGWLRLSVALTLLTIPLALAAVFQVFDVAPWISTCVYLGLLPLTVFGAMRGVAMARRGDSVDWKSAERFIERVSQWEASRSRPFSSVAAAQFWLEFRTFGRMLPGFVCLILPLIALMSLAFHWQDVSGVSRLYVMTLFLPTIFAATLSAIGGKLETPFVTTRPIENSQIISSKVRVALASCLLSSAATLLVFPFLLGRPAVFRALWEGLAAMGPVKGFLVVLVAIAGPPLLAWKLMVENLWLGLAGRVWVMNTWALGVAALFGVGTLLGLWVLVRPDLQLLLKEAAPYLVAGILAAKLALAVWLLRDLFRRGLAMRKVAWMTLGLWALLVAGATGLIFWQVERLPLSAGVIVAAIAISMPLNRVAVMPMMLEWHRHR